ncbi:MAG: YgcG family protein [Leptospiraceae bacterium]|nr:YgcG family protein [Leptospiraceae bacterium]
MFFSAAKRIDFIRVPVPCWFAGLVLVIFSFLIGVPAPLLAQESETDGLPAIPAVSSRWATDYTGTLDAAKLNALNQRLRDFEQQKGSQVVVVIVNSTRPLPIEDYSIRLAEKWKVGRKGVDDGVILLIAKNDRKLRIEVGYGLEGAIPDAKAKQIIEDLIVPQFKAGEFEAGVEAGVDAIIALINGEELPAPEKTTSISDWGGAGSAFFFIGMFISAMLSWKWRLIISTAASLLFIFVATLFFDFQFGFAVSVSIILWLFMVIGGWIMSHGGGSGGSYSSGGGWSSGGGGFSGGFSGGGGSFGGGGSSGSW